jgi:hypothetical protein
MTTWNLRAGSVAFLALAVLFTLGGLARGQAEEEGTATLKVVRKSSFSMSLVTNGKSAELSIPASRKKQTIIFKSALISSQVSPQESFEAKPGAVVVVTCEANAYTFSLTEVIKIDSIVTEKEGAWKTGSTTPADKPGVTHIGKIRLTDKKTEKEAKRDRVESDVGGTTKYAKSRTIKREISFSTRVGLTAEAEARLRAGIILARAEVTGRIKASVEAEFGEKWTDEITEAAEHTIDLDKHPKVEVIWIDVYRGGSVEVTVDGKTHVVPFEFPVATRTVIKAVK